MNIERRKINVKPPPTIRNRRSPVRETAVDEHLCRSPGTLQLTPHALLCTGLSAILEQPSTLSMLHDIAPGGPSRDAGNAPPSCTRVHVHSPDDCSRYPSSAIPLHLTAQGRQCSPDGRPGTLPAGQPEGSCHTQMPGHTRSRRTTATATARPC